MIRLDITVDDIDQIIAAGYTHIRIYTDTSEDGAFTTLDGSVALVASRTGYAYVDTDGSTSTWYKTCYYTGSSESEKSAAQQGGTLDAYATALDVRKELASGSGASAISQAYDDVLWDMLVEASRLIDAYKNVEAGGYMAAGSEARYFDGNGKGWLWLDGSPAVSISAVAVEEVDGTYTTWAATDYLTWPYNETPIRRLDVNAKTGGTKSSWTPGAKRVKITGVWGWSTTPPELIARAAKIQAARWYKQAMQGWSDVGGPPTMGILRYTRQLDEDVKTLLDLADPQRGIL